jgi:hypothetical protein
MVTRPVPNPSTPGRQPLGVRSRRDLFRRISVVVHHLAPRWDTDNTSVVVVKNTRVSPADIQTVFDTISEKYHVAGINLRYTRQANGYLRAIFERGAASNETHAPAGHSTE